jgi:hypothetical protein
VIFKITCVAPVCLLLSASTAAADDVVDLAARLVGRPYVWGAEGPNAFDCSGLVQYVHQKLGIELPRRAISQSKAGKPAGTRLRRGDLLFFSSDARRSLVTHVGLYEGDGVMIEASKRSGRVRRDSLSDPYWIERFMFARRITSTGAQRDGSDRRVERSDDPAPPSRDRGKAAVRVLKGIAGVLLELPRR